MNAGTTKVVIVGAAGFTNLGDDAILAAILAELRPALTAAHFTIAGGHPAALPAGSDILPLSLDSPYLTGSIATADLLIVGGGGLFYDHYERPVPVTGLLEGSEDGSFPYYRAVLTAHLYGVPIFFYGVGVGPLVTATGRRLARLAFSLATAITVRDSFSQHELVALGVDDPWPQLTADPAVRLATVVAPPPAQRQVGFAVRPWLAAAQTAWSTAHSEHYLTTLAQLADHAVARWDATPRFLIFQQRNDDDRLIATTVIARMRHGLRAVIDEDLATYQDAQALLAQCDALVSTRLHALIFGGLAAVPVLGIALDGKVRAFLASLDLAWCCRSPWGGQPAQLIAVLDQLLADPAPIRAQLAQGFADQAARAARNPQIAAALVDRGRPLAVEGE